MPVSRLRKNRKPFGEKRLKYIGSGPVPRDTPWVLGVAAVLSAWFVIFREPYGILFAALVLLPVVVMVWRGAGIKPYTTTIVNDNYNGGAVARDGMLGRLFAPIVGVAGWLLWPATALAIRILLDFDTENFNRSLIVWAGTMVIMLVLLFATHQWPRQGTAKRTTQNVALFLVLAVYAWGAGVGLNCIGDISPGEVLRVAVIDKHKSKSPKSEDYLLTVQGWGNKPYRKFDVSQSFYDSVEQGGEVTLHLRKGLFGIGWVYITIN